MIENFEFEILHLMADGRPEDPPSQFATLRPTNIQIQESLLAESPKPSTVANPFF